MNYDSKESKKMKKKRHVETFFGIETKPLQEFDIFIADCRDFIGKFYSHQQKQPASVASKLG
jgi:hypothetical protein